jgi:O-antigen/teichoic acid export membrane protein
MDKVADTGAWFRKVTASAVGLGASQAAGLAAGLLIARTLGAEAYGLLGLALSLGVYGAFFCRWGDAPLLLKTLSQTPEKAAVALNLFLRLRVFMAVFAVCIAAVVIGFGFEAQAQGLMWLGLFSVLPTAFSPFPAFDAKGKTALHALGTGIRQAVFLLMAAAFLYGAANPQPEGVLGLKIISVLVVLFWEWTWVRRAWSTTTPDAKATKSEDRTPPERFNPSDGALGLWFSTLPMATATLIVQFYLNLGVWALAGFQKDKELGAYVLATQWITVIGAFIYLAARGASREVSASTANRQLHQKTVRRWLIRLSCLALGGIAVLIFAVSPLMNAFLGRGYEGLGLILALGAWRIWPEALGAVYETALIAQGRTKTAARMHFIGALTGLVFVLTGAWFLGAPGCALGVAMGRAASCLAGGYFMKHGACR